MQSFTIHVPGGSFLGTAKNNGRVESDRFLTISANSVEDMRVAANIVGPEISQTENWDGFSSGRTSVLSNLFEQHGQQERSKAFHADLADFLKRVTDDLGSVAINRVTLEHADTKFTVARMRIEVAEGERHRVVYVEPSSAIREAKVSDVVEAILAYF